MFDFLARPTPGDTAMAVAMALMLLFGIVITFGLI